MLICDRCEEEFIREELITLFYENTFTVHSDYVEELHVPDYSDRVTYKRKIVRQRGHFTNKFFFRWCGCYELDDRLISYVTGTPSNPQMTLCASCLPERLRCEGISWPEKDERGIYKPHGPLEKIPICDKSIPIQDWTQNLCPFCHRILCKDHVGYNNHFCTNPKYLLLSFETLRDFGECIRGKVQYSWDKEMQKEKTVNYWDVYEWADKIRSKNESSSQCK